MWKVSALTLRERAASRRPQRRPEGFPQQCSRVLTLAVGSDASEPRDFKTHGSKGRFRWHHVWSVGSSVQCRR
jgi:hypothetical protein